MGNILLLLAILFWGCLSGAQDRPQNVLSFVFDLDSTLLETIGYRKISDMEFAEYETHERVTEELIRKADFKFLDYTKTTHLSNPQFLDSLIEAKEFIKDTPYLTYYRVMDWAKELIEYILHDIPQKTGLQVEIHTFSGSNEFRNEQALAKIPLDQGPLIEAVEKILSFHHLHEVPAHELPPEPRFADRYKKDMHLISADIRNVLLIDDYHGFVAKGQHKNQLTLFGVTWHFEELSDRDHFYEKQKDLRIPQNEEALFVSKNRLAFVQGVLARAVQKFTKKGNTQSFTEIVHELSKNSSESLFLLTPRQIQNRKEYQYLQEGLNYFKSKTRVCSQLFR